jgi:hypothetical protein
VFCSQHLGPLLVGVAVSLPSELLACGLREQENGQEQKEFLQEISSCSTSSEEFCNFDSFS